MKIMAMPKKIILRPRGVPVATGAVVVGILDWQ